MLGDKGFEPMNTVIIIKKSNSEINAEFETNPLLLIKAEWISNRNEFQFGFFIATAFLID